MTFIVDIIILLIVALFTFIGYKQGLIKSAIKILAFFIAIIVAITLYKPAATLVIDKTQIDENIEVSIADKILPEGMKKDQQIPQENTITSSIVETANKTVEEVSKNLTIKIIEVACFLLLFIVCKLILRFISILSKVITKLPIIKQLDKTGGIIYGFIKGVLIVLVAFAIINLIAPLLQDNLLDLIKGSFIGNILFNHNFLIQILK